MSTSAGSRPRRAKGPEPKFFDDPSTHRLLAIVTALAGEVSVIRERLDTHERLAAEGKVATPKAIESFEPDAAVEDERELWRAGYLSRVYRVLDFAASDRSGIKSGDDELDRIADRFAGPE